MVIHPFNLNKMIYLIRPSDVYCAKAKCIMRCRYIGVESAVAVSHLHMCVMFDMLTFCI